MVAPILDRRWPRLRYAAGRLGTGSDVFGWDDDRSRDHDWGLRLHVLVEPTMVTAVDDHLADELPGRWAGWPTRFATTWDPRVRHRVEVTSPADFAHARLGLDPTAEWTSTEWLSLTGQAVLEITAGPVFIDSPGELTALRERLRWYPDELWRYVVGVDWCRIRHELPFVGRTGELGDEVGSRVVTARLVRTVLHLGHLLERRWPPYAKWLAASFHELPRAGAAGEHLATALAADTWPRRQAALGAALTTLHELQRDIHLPVGQRAAGKATTPFHDRPFLTVHPSVISSSTDDLLPVGFGSIEQWCDSVDVLTNPVRRLNATRAMLTR